MVLKQDFIGTVISLVFVMDSSCTVQNLYRFFAEVDWLKIYES